MNKQRENFLFLSASITVMLVIVALYGVALRFPFYSDDVPTFAYVPTIDLIDVWTDTGVFGTWFRPLPYTLYWLQWPAWAYYLLVLMTHLINTALVGRLAQALGWGKLAGLMAMALFALLPFNAQAAMWITSYVHPLTTMLALLAAVSAVYALRTKHITWTITALMAVIAAPFAHESGVTTIALVGLSLLTAFGVRGLLLRWRRTLILLSAAAGSAIAFWVIRGAMVEGDAGLGSVYVMENWAFVLQWWTYPAQLLTRFLPIDVTTQILIGALIFGALLLVMIVWRGGWRALWIGAAWMVAAASPALAFLHPNYLDWSERVLYLSGAGLALLLGGVLAKLPRSLALMVLSLLVLVSSAIDWQIRSDMLAHDAFSDDLMALYTGDESPSTLLLNLPSYSERSTLLLPLAEIRAFMLSDWIELDDFMAVNGGQAAEGARAVQQYNLQPVWDGRDVTYFGAQLELNELPATVREHQRVVMSAFSDGAYHLHTIGERFTAPETVDLRFGDGLALHGWQTERDGSQVRVGLDWQRLTDAVAIPEVAFVHLTCDGVLIDQADGAPLSNLYPFDLWDAGEAWRDWRVLDAGDADADCLGVRVGLYERETGARLPLMDATGAVMDVDFVTFGVE